MSGGGGSSGSIDYPAYLENIHSHWLTHNTLTVGDDEMTYSVADLMETAQTGSSPYDGETAIDPDTVFLKNAIGTYKGPYELLEDFYGWDVDTAYTTYSDDDATDSLVDAFADNLNDEYEERVLPQYRVQFADINATMSSAMPIGEALISATKLKEIAKFDGQTRIGVTLQRIGLKMEWNRLVSVLASENSRLYLASKHEEQHSNLDFSSKDALWDLDVYQYGFRAMAAIAGTANPSIPDNKPSAMGAAVSGAAAGALVASSIPDPTGTSVAVGAIIGGTIGLASTL